MLVDVLVVIGAASLLSLTAIVVWMVWADRKRKECPRCRHSWAEHLWGRGCQRAGCCCQGGILSKKEAENGYR